MKKANIIYKNSIEIKCNNWFCSCSWPTVKLKEDRKLSNNINRTKYRINIIPRFLLIIILSVSYLSFCFLCNCWNISIQLDIFSKNLFKLLCSSFISIKITKQWEFNILFQAYPTDEKPLSKIQSIVLRHLYLLLGYNQTDKIHHTSPQRLRWEMKSLMELFY